jgi:hypothetical protein
MTEQRYAVVVTLPTDSDAPEGLDPVRRVGPYHHKSTAETAIAAFGMMVASSAPTGTRFELVAYDATLPHLDAEFPRDAYRLAEMVREEPDGPGGGWGFPDLYARLSAYLGADEARDLWRRACSYLDAEEAEAEREQAERAATTRERLDLAEKFDDEIEHVFSTGGPHGEYVSRAAARSIAALIRYLNHATYHREAAPYPSTIDSVVRAIGAGITGLDQLLRQLDALLAAQAAGGNLYSDDGRSAVEVVAGFRVHLDYARRHAADLAGELAAAGRYGNHLGVRDPAPAEPTDDHE